MPSQTPTPAGTDVEPAHIAMPAAAADIDRMQPQSPAEPDSDFPPTQPLPHDLGAETLALIAGDLGDPVYRVDSFAESLDWVRRMAHSGQAATLVVLRPHADRAPEVHLVFSARIRRIDEAQHSLLIELPPTSPPVDQGLTLRGSARVQGVIVTFECETLGTESAGDGLPQMLRARLPFRLYRLQRRDSFRVPVPATHSVLVSLKPGWRHLENLKALDLSCGGVSVLVRAPLEAVHQGKRFAGGLVTLGPNAAAGPFKVDMLIRHVRLAPPGLSQMLVASTPKPRIPPPPAARGGAPTSREAALAAVGALLQPELLQLGIEFEHMPAPLERQLARLVNELGAQLVARVRDEL